MQTRIRLSYKNANSALNFIGYVQDKLDLVSMDQSEFDPSSHRPCEFTWAVGLRRNLTICPQS